VRLVDGGGALGAVAQDPVPHPLPAPPLEPEAPHDGPGVRGGLPVEGEGVGLVEPVPVPAGDDVVLVGGPPHHPGDESLPDPGHPLRPEGVGAFVPSVEAPRDIYVLGVGGPYGEVGTLLPVHGHEVGSQLFVQPEVASLVEEVQVLVGKKGHVVSHGSILPPPLSAWFPALRRRSISRRMRITWGISGNASNPCRAFLSQFGRSFQVPGTFWGSVSRYRSSRLTMTTPALLAAREERHAARTACAPGRSFPSHPVRRRTDASAFFP